MSNLIKLLLSGFTNTTSTESEEKDNKMLNFTTSVPELDLENSRLFRAAEILEKMGNSPDLTADEFTYQLIQSGCNSEDIHPITLAAIAIETMITLDHLYTDPDSLVEPPEPTIH